MPSSAHAALPDDVPTCRCIEELISMDDAVVSEATRRAAERVWDSYCDANYPLEDASGHEQSVADQACELAFGSLEDVDDGVVRPHGARVECTLVLTPAYRAHGVTTDLIRQWRHHYGVGLTLRLDWRPGSATGGGR